MLPMIAKTRSHMSRPSLLRALCPVGTAVSPCARPFVRLRVSHSLGDDGQLREQRLKPACSDFPTQPRLCGLPIWRDLDALSFASGSETPSPLSPIVTRPHADPPRLTEWFERARQRGGVDR